tara:strand:- start:56 stop:304 length:249 start_codon:yes stop_codon:yes gene_type:complete
MSPPKLVSLKTLKNLDIPPPSDKHFIDEQKWNICIVLVLVIGFIVLLGRFKGIHNTNLQNLPDSIKNNAYHQKILTENLMRS